MVAGIFFVVAIAACWRILILSKNERAESEQQLSALSNDLAAANQAATNAKNAAKEALKASEPKPLKERLKICLDSIDVRLLPTLKVAGSRGVHFRGEVSEYKYEELHKLSEEPGASEFITFRPAMSIMISNISGTQEPVDIDLKSALLNP